MLSRARLIALAGHAKKLGVADRALRYNLLPRRRVLKAIAGFEAATDLAERRRLSDALAVQSAAAARATQYGRRFGPSVADWPVLNKASVRDAPENFMTSGLLRVPAATGGTTGLPVRLARSATCIAAEQVFLDTLCRGRGPSWGRARIASLRGDAIKDTSHWSPPFGVEMQGGRRLILSSPHLCRETLPWYADALAAYRPDILWLWPTMAANLLRLLQQAGRRLTVPLVLTSSERLDLVLRAEIGRAWDAQVIDYYGQAERSSFAVSDAGELFRFHPAYGRVELLPCGDGDALPGRRLVRIVSTGFWNEAMPLIRYDTGDRAVVPEDASAEDLEAIALGLAPFLGIAGRDGEFIRSPAGDQICGLNQLPREVMHLLRLQIVQDRLDSVTVRALVGPGFGPADRALLEANARAKIPGAMSVQIDLVEKLETLASGKTPFILQRLPAETEDAAGAA